MSEQILRVKRGAIKVAPKGLQHSVGKQEEFLAKKGIRDQFKEDVLTRKQAKASQRRQEGLLSKQKKAEELRLGEEKSELARRALVGTASTGRRSLLAGG